jgi:hypothetical protein
VTEALIDGLWLRAALSADGPDPVRARRLVLDYLNARLGPSFDPGFDPGFDRGLGLKLG